MICRALGEGSPNPSIPRTFLFPEYTYPNHKKTMILNLSKLIFDFCVLILLTGKYRFLFFIST